MPLAASILRLDGPLLVPFELEFEFFTGENAALPPIGTKFVIALEAEWELRSGRGYLWLFVSPTIFGPCCGSVEELFQSTSISISDEAGIAPLSVTILLKIFKGGLTARRRFNF